MGTMKVITPPCFHCNEGGEVEVDTQAYWAWTLADDNDPMRHAQYAFPNLSADVREMLISGTHPKCWTEMFGEEG
jgi:hypothetical protein